MPELVHACLPWLLQTIVVVGWLLFQPRNVNMVVTMPIPFLDAGICMSTSLRPGSQYNVR